MHSTLNIHLAAARSSDVARSARHRFRRRFV
jgi:hypothetical protein